MISILGSLGKAEFSILGSLGKAEFSILGIFPRIFLT